MPRRSDLCPQCGRQKQAISALCRRCRDSTPYPRTTEVRAKIAAAKIGNKSKTGLQDRPETLERKRAAWTPAHRAAAKERGLTFAADRAWRDLIAASVSGERNPNYQGKGKATPYAPGWGRHHKHLIRVRAGFRCEICSVRPSRTLDIHHRDKSKTNHHPDNLQALCRRCHKAVHPNSGAR